MHAAPVLRGGWVARAAWLVGGLFLCACGILAFLESRLGLPPWDVLHQGIAKHTPLSFGEANEVVAIGVLFVAWRLGSRPGIATVANAVLIGTGLYIGAGLGAGPRDSLMLVGAVRSGVRIGVVRAALEGTALAAGIVLGGKVGVGTLVFAFLIGPAVEASFWLVTHLRLTR
jgi:uncharacterized membrane protein YczE